MDKPQDKNQVHETRLWFDKKVWHTLKAAIKDAKFWEVEFGRSPSTLQEAVHILVESLCEKYSNKGVGVGEREGISHHTYSENAQSTADREFIPQIDVSALVPSGVEASSIHKSIKEGVSEKELENLEIDSSKLGVEPVIPLRVSDKGEDAQKQKVSGNILSDVKEKKLGEPVFRVNGKIVPLKKQAVKPVKIPSLSGGPLPDVKRAHEEGVRAAEKVRRLFSTYLTKKHEIEAKFRLKRIDGLSYRRMIDEAKKEYEIALKYV